MRVSFYISKHAAHASHHKFLVFLISLDTRLAQAFRFLVELLEIVVRSLETILDVPGDGGIYLPQLGFDSHHALVGLVNMRHAGGFSVSLGRA